MSGPPDKERTEALAAMSASAAVRDAALAERRTLLHAGWPVDNGFVRALDSVARDMAAAFEGFRDLATGVLCVGCGKPMSAHDRMAQCQVSSGVAADHHEQDQT